MRRKSLTEFIRANRAGIDAAIKRSPGMKGADTAYWARYGRLNDKERRSWVLNDEGLYLWARSEGVRI